MPIITSGADMLACAQTGPQNPKPPLTLPSPQSHYIPQLIPPSPPIHFLFYHPLYLTFVRFRQNSRIPHPGALQIIRQGPQT